LGLGVALADALCDIFELPGYFKHLIVVATGYNGGSVDVSAAQDFGGYQDQPGLYLAAEEPLHGFGPL